MRAPFMAGSFPFPVKYGYSIVGRIEDGPAELLGRDVFVLHPHQSLFQCRREALSRCCRMACRPSAPCLPPIWRPRSTRSGMRRPGRPTASLLSAPASSARWSASCVGHMAGAEVTLIDINPRARGDRAQSWRQVCQAGSGADGLRHSHPCQRQRRRACDCARARGRGSDRARTELVRRRRKCRSRSEPRSIAGGCG